jgi:hypothetical protein
LYFFFKTLNRHWRLRIKSRFWIDRLGRPPCNANRLSWALGEAPCWQDVTMPHSHDGPVYPALARRQDGQEAWLVVSDAPTTVKTCEADGWRVAIAENFWDDQAHGVQLESSLLRSAAALER